MHYKDTFIILTLFYQFKSGLKFLNLPDETFLRGQSVATWTSLHNRTAMLRLWCTLFSLFNEVKTSEEHCPMAARQWQLRCHFPDTLEIRWLSRGADPGPRARGSLVSCQRYKRSTDEMQRVQVAHTEQPPGLYLISEEASGC